MSMEPRKRVGLGRGLSALLGDEPAIGHTGDNAATMLPVALIHPDPDQPRRYFAADALAELAESIRAHGVLQPILVRPDGGQYRIVAGERRWRAAQQAGLHDMPAVVRTYDGTAALEAAIVENIQRQDLNAIEEAQAYRRLISEFGYTQDQLGQRMHKSRSHVANLLRLLDLPNEVQQAVVSGALSMGHARALAALPDPAASAKEAIRRGLSVRDVEKMAKEARPNGKKTPASPDRSSPDADIVSLERHLQDMLGLDVRIVYSHADKAGSVTLSYHSLEQLDLICRRLNSTQV